MDYVNNGSVQAIGFIFSILTLIVIAIRAYAWIRTLKSIEVDDILSVPAAIFTIATGAALIIGAQLDIIGGHSLPAITPTQQVQLGKFQYAFWMGHVLAICFIKLTILFLFRRIFKGQSSTTPFDYTNWTLIALVIGWTVAFFFTDVFACGTDPSISWSSLISLRTKCVDTFLMQTCCAIFSWVLDLAILVEPLFMIGSLNMNLKRKLQTSLVFLFSALAVIAGLLRMVIWIQLMQQDVTQPSTKLLATVFVTADQTGAVSLVIFWTYIEIGVGFIVACLPPCAAIIDQMSFSRMKPSLRSLSSTLPRSKRGNASTLAGSSKTERSLHSRDSWTDFGRTRGQDQGPDWHTFDDEFALSPRSQQHV